MLGGLSSPFTKDFTSTDPEWFAPHIPGLQALWPVPSSTASLDARGPFTGVWASVSPFILGPGLCALFMRGAGRARPVRPDSETGSALSPRFQEQLLGSQQAHSGVWLEANANPSIAGTRSRWGQGWGAAMGGECGPSVWEQASRAFPPPCVSWTGCQRLSAHSRPLLGADISCPGCPRPTRHCLAGKRGGLQAGLGAQAERVQGNATSGGRRPLSPGRDPGHCPPWPQD